MEILAIIQTAATGRLDPRLIGPRALLAILLELSPGLPIGLEWVTPLNIENSFKFYQWTLLRVYSVKGAIRFVGNVPL